MDVVEHRRLSAGLKLRLPAFLLAIGFAPLVYWHVGGLLERPHYQFVVLFPMAIWMLYGSCRDATQPLAGNWATGIGIVGLVVCLAGLAVSAWYWSPWLASVVAMLASISLLLATQGLQGVRKWFPVWAYCLILIPLPFGLDQDVIVRLRGLTTRISSKFLDFLGILHQNYANVIELPGKPLFIADACSGIHSLYVLMALALFVCVWLRRSLLHSLSLLVATSSLVLVENVLRIVAVAFAWTRGVDLSEGSPHTLLGAVLFCFSGAMVFSLDQILLFFLPLELTFRRLFEDEGRDSFVGSKIVPARASVAWSNIVLIVCGLFPVLAVLQFFKMPSTSPQVLAMFQQELVLPKFGEKTLPSELFGFKQDEYRMINRVPGDPFGRSSQQWSYRKGDLTAHVYLDYPFEAPHDLCLCYSLIGWSVSDAEVCPQSEKQPETAVATLAREFYGQSLIFFSQFDLNGRASAFVKKVVAGDGRDKMAKRFQSLGQEQAPASNGIVKQFGPLIQVQMFVSGFDEQQEISDATYSELLQFYYAVREQLTARVLNRSTPVEVN
jgi:exosortase